MCLLVQSLGSGTCNIIIVNWAVRSTVLKSRRPFESTLMNGATVPLYLTPSSDVRMVPYLYETRRTQDTSLPSSHVEAVHWITLFVHPIKSAGYSIPEAFFLLLLPTTLLRCKYTMFDSICLIITATSLVLSLFATKHTNRTDWLQLHFTSICAPHLFSLREIRPFILLLTKATVSHKNEEESNGGKKATRFTKLSLLQFLWFITISPSFLSFYPRYFVALLLLFCL